MWNPGHDQWKDVILLAENRPEIEKKVTYPDILALILFKLRGSCYSFVVSTGKELDAKLWTPTSRGARCPPTCPGTGGRDRGSCWSTYWSSAQVSPDNLDKLCLSSYQFQRDRKVDRVQDVYPSPPIFRPIGLRLHDVQWAVLLPRSGKTAQYWCPH